jgi:hypothetical protein
VHGDPRQHRRSGPESAWPRKRAARSRVPRLLAVVAATLLVTPAVASPATPAAVDVPGNRLPPSGTREIAEHGTHLTWVDRLPDTAGQPVDVVLDRSAGRTIGLPIAPVRDLDLGRGPGGRPTAVYVRCTPSCDIWRYDFARRSERRVARLSAAGVSEHLPTIWGSRVAFERGRSVLLADLGRGRPRTIARRVFPDDIELGAKHLAYVGLFERGAGNGTVELRLRGLASAAEQVLADGVIGEGASTGFGALTFAGRTLFWQARSRHGCRIFAPGLHRYDVRADRAARRIGRRGAPVTVRRAAVVPPATPESDACG